MVTASQSINPVMSNIFTRYSSSNKSGIIIYTTVIIHYSSPSQLIGEKLIKFNILQKVKCFVMNLCIILHFWLQSEVFLELVKLSLFDVFESDYQPYIVISSRTLMYCLLWWCKSKDISSNLSTKMFCKMYQSFILKSHYRTQWEVKICYDM